MKQLRLFDTVFDEEIITHTSDLWELFIDGASRNNPGPAAVGFFVVKNGVPVCKQGFFLGKKTNNQAEYLALIIAVFFLKGDLQTGDRIHVFSDSQLLVRQIEGLYAVKHANLTMLYALSKKLMSQFSFVIHHIPREKNEIADDMANQAIDKIIPLPEYIITMLHEHGIQI